MANNDESNLSKHNNFNNNNNNQDDSIPDNFDAKSYNLSGKIMLCAIVFLFFVVIIMLCLHIYARWYLLRARRRHLRRNRLRRHTQLIFYTDNPTAVINSSTSHGLDASVIASLPLFLYDPNTHPEITSECAVCLSEFESGETGRVLPKCNHAFHIECIDMWFISHSTCPLCRAPVEPTQTRSEVGFNVFGSEPGSSSGIGLEENRNGGREICSSSVGLRRKPSFVGVSIEVPSRNEDFGCDSPSTQSSFRSPMSRMLSLKRILSKEKKGSVSPSSCGGCGCSSAAEVDVERGGRDETQ